MFFFSVVFDQAKSRFIHIGVSQKGIMEEKFLLNIVFCPIRPVEQNGVIPIFVDPMVGKVADF
jgi:hypothetical protein